MDSIQPRGQVPLRAVVSRQKRKISGKKDRRLVSRLCDCVYHESWSSPFFFSFSFSGVLSFRVLYPVRLVLVPAVRIHSGMGGVIFLSPPSGAVGVFGSDSSWTSDELASAFRKDSRLPCRLRGLGMGGKLPLRIRCRDRMLALSEMTCPALGAAMTMVPGVAIRGGAGESERKRGWM